MKHLKIQLSVLFLIFIQINMLYPQTSKDNNVSLNNQVDALFAVWNTNETPGASIAIVKDGTIIYKKGYGMANLEYNISNSSSTVFHIASISKQFTVFSILLLEEEGKLSLDDDIRKYIPEVPDFGKTITLRHLATHTSGLRDQWSLLGLAGWRRDDVITKAHILKLISKQNALNFNPGEFFLYCNTGFTLLAEVVSRVSGQTFAEFTKANIFEPLQMSSTLFYDDHEKIVQNRAYSYYPDSLGYKKSVLNYANVGATSLFTTVEDFSHWALNFSLTKIGNKEIVTKMNTLVVLNNGKKISAGLGQFVGKYKGLNEIQHGGGDAGYRSYFARYPDQNFSVVIFSNDASFKPNVIAHKIVDIYLKDRIKDEYKKGTINETFEEPKNISVSQDILNTYVGNYDIKPGVAISITTKEGQLFLQASGDQMGLLIPATNTEFIAQNGKAKISFITSRSQSVSSLKLHVNGRVIDAIKEIINETFEDPNKISVSQDILNTYVGNYEIKPSVAISITTKNGQLFMQPPGNEVASLIPASNTEFIVKDGKNKVSFITTKNQTVSSLKLHVNGRIIEAIKIKTIEKATIKLTDFEGHFYSEELSAKYQFVLVNGQLIAKHKRLNDIILKFEKEDVFSGNQWFFGKIEFIRDANNVILECKISSNRARNILFKKL